MADELRVVNSFMAKMSCFSTVPPYVQKEIVAVTHTDEDLVGGMTVQIGDMMIDGSVRTRLNEVRETLVSQRIGSDLFDESESG